MNKCFKNIFASKTNDIQSIETVPCVIPQKGIDFYETNKIE